MITDFIEDADVTSGSPIAGRVRHSRPTVQINPLFANQSYSAEAMDYGREQALRWLEQDSWSGFWNEEAYRNPLKARTFSREEVGALGYNLSINYAQQ